MPHTVLCMTYYIDIDTHDNSHTNKNLQLSLYSYSHCHFTVWYKIVLLTKPYTKAFRRIGLGIFSQYKVK